MTTALYRLAQWRHGHAKRFKAAPRIFDTVAIIGACIPPPERGRVLSIGPRNLFEVTALEWFGPVDAVDLFPTHPRIRRGDMDALPCDTNDYALTFLSHSWEHARDLERAAEEIMRVTKPGGAVWIAVPAGQDPTAHDRHRFDTVTDVTRHFERARPAILFSDVRPGRDVRVLMRLRKDGPKRILYLVPDAMARRNVEASGLVRQLAVRGHAVAILEAGGLMQGSRFRQWLRRGPLRTMVYMSRAAAGEVTYQHKLALRTAWRQLVEIGLLRVLTKCWHGEVIGRAVERWLPVDRRARRAVAALRPDVVVSHSAIYDGGDAEIVKAAQRAKIPTLLQVASFDTLTSKGGPLVRHDVVATWGEASRAQAIVRHGFAPEQVVVTGPVHFDVYAGPGRVPSPAPDELRYILVAGTTVAYHKDEHALVQRLGAWAAQQPGTTVLYRPHPRLLYRPHPRQFRGAATLQAPPHILVDTSGLEARPSQLRLLLESATCVVSAWSTMVIEAALLGVPSLIVGFGESTGGSEVQGRGGRLIDHAGFEHVAEVVQWPGVFVCPSQAALEVGLVNMLEMPRATREEMAAGLRAAAGRVAHCLDGGATRRMIDLIERTAK